MALFTPGPIVGQVSGAIGSTVFSHNRGGAYARTRAIPTKVTNQYTTAVRNRLSSLSQAWGGLTEAQQTGWKTWAAVNPIINRLGAPRILQGNAAFVQINARIMAASAAPIDDPPIAASPDALLTLSATYDIGAGDFALTFTGTPLAATEQLWTRGCVVDNPGRRYVENLTRLVDVSAAALASPYDIQSAFEDRFGTLQVGQMVYFFCAVVDNATGLLSGFRATAGLVITT